MGIANIKNKQLSVNNFDSRATTGAVINRMIYDIAATSIEINFATRNNIAAIITTIAIPLAVIKMFSLTFRFI